MTIEERVKLSYSKSLYFTDSKIHEQIDELLKQNASLEASLGKDSTSKERVKIKVKQDRLFGKIRKLDEEFYNIIVTERNE